MQAAPVAKDMSPFYSREFYTKKSMSEERQVFRWFQLMEKNYMLYNVVNKHDCIRADREAKEAAHLQRRPHVPLVVQPFCSVDNFYGCLVCGKYHICHLKSESCLVVTDRLDKQKVCAYSGKLLHIQDNLEVANFLDERSAEKEALPMILAHPGSKKRSSPKKKTNSPNGKKPYKSHVLELFKQGSPVQENPGRGRSLKRRHSGELPSKEECQRMVGDIYDLSIESLSVSEEEEEDEGVASCTQGSIGEEEDDMPCEHVIEEGDEYSDDDLCLRYAKRQRLNCSDDGETEGASSGKDGKMGSAVVVIEDDEVRDYYEREESGDEGGGGGGGGGCYGTEYENVNGEGSHVKNYHNNIRYKNEYYDFLQREVAKQKKTALQMDRYDRFMDMYARDMKEEALSSLVKQKEEEGEEEEGEAEHEDENEITALVEEEPVKKTATAESLNESICAKIENEVDILVDTLLDIDPTQRANCTLKRSVIHKALTSHFVLLVKNITFLVYQSPHLNKLAVERASKNQSQASKFKATVIDAKSVENPQSDLEYHEGTLCPRKIASSLLLHLFTKPLWMTDCLSHKLCIWDTDRWLRLFACKDRRKLATDYHYRVTGSMKENERFYKEVSETAALVEKCLRFYRFCPLWLRAMVFKTPDPSGNF